MLERCHGVGAAGAFLDGADAAFDVRYMFFLAADVEVRVQVASDGAAGAFKLRVAKDNSNAEASLPIYAVNVLQCFDERRCLAIRQNGGCNESYISGYGEEKRNFVHEHNINTERDVAVLCHDGLRDVCEVGTDAREGTAGCLALHGADVTSKDMVCIYCILSGNGTVWEGVPFDVAEEILEFRSAN
jgi:hypothetical protein